MAQLHLDPDELRSLVHEIVAHVVHELEEFKLVHNGRIGFSEAAAADLLELNSHQLRDLRRDGKIGHSRVVGNRVRYTIDDIRTYLRQGYQPGTNRDA